MFCLSAVDLVTASLRACSNRAVSFTANAADCEFPAGRPSWTLNPTLAGAWMGINDPAAIPFQPKADYVGSATATAKCSRSEKSTTVRVGAGGKGITADKTMACVGS